MLKYADVQVLDKHESKLKIGLFAKEKDVVERVSNDVEVGDLVEVFVKCSQSSVSSLTWLRVTMICKNPDGSVKLICASDISPSYLPSLQKDHYVTVKPEHLVNWAKSGGFEENRRKRKGLLSRFS